MSRLRQTLLLASIAVLATAHVGSPDTVFEGAAGPYPVRVIVRPPGIVPGRADIAVRILSGDGVRSVLVQPLKGGRPTAEEPPPDTARIVPGEPRLYSAQLWLMDFGAYSVRVDVAGTAGDGSVIVPVNSVATRRLAFQRPLAIALLGLGAFLFVGALTIVGAAVRESVLPPGAEPDAARRQRSWWARAAAVWILVIAVWGGKKWWDAEDANHAGSLYRPLSIASTITTATGGARLRVAVTDSDYLARRWSALVPDHGKLMHLFLVRDGLTAFAHLHPLALDSSTFETALPPLPAGRYRLYADIVHESGFTQTLLDSVTVRGGATTWRPTDPDDSWRDVTATSDVGREKTVALEDRSTMTLLPDAAPIVAGRDIDLRFSVATPNGQPATLEPYMGMATHAVVSRGDGAVFVHLHSAGTVAMASQLVYQLRQPGDTIRGRLGQRITTAEFSPMHEPRFGATLTIPYAFPRPGPYRLWVQVKRAGRVLTGVFDLDVVAS